MQKQTELLQEWDDVEMEEQLKKLEEEITTQRNELATDRLDISFGELLNLYSDHELRIKPEYQRLFRWTGKQKTAFIESILMGVPIPPIFVAEDSDGVWELVDGLQRVSTVISFFGKLSDDIAKPISEIIPNVDNDVPDANIEEENGKISTENKWTLEEGSRLKNLEGLTIDELPNKYRIGIKRAVCRVEILRGKSNTSMKYELFKRLNSGGSKLTAQEIRNAIYRGIDPRLNELIEQLSQNACFKELTTLSSKKKQELYDQELILRFIAFYDSDISNINSNTESFLDGYMQQNVGDQRFDPDKFKFLFEKVMTLLQKNYGERVFKNEKNIFVPALFEGISIGVALNVEQYEQRPDLLKEKIDLLKTDEQFKKLSGTASNSKRRVRNRLKRVTEIFGIHS